jgi:hypothetical protein
MAVWYGKIGIANNSYTLAYLSGSKEKHNNLFIVRLFVGKTRGNKNSKQRTQTQLRILSYDSRKNPLNVRQKYQTY